MLPVGILIGAHHNILHLEARYGKRVIETKNFKGEQWYVHVCGSLAKEQWFIALSMSWTDMYKLQAPSLQDLVQVVPIAGDLQIRGVG